MDNQHTLDRQTKWQAHLESYAKAAKTLEDGWKELEHGHQELDGKKKALAQQNGGSDVKDSDILDINAGGHVIRVTRGTLTQVKGSRLEAIFSGRWEKQLQRDLKQRIFLDVNPTCFNSIVDYLNECKIAPPDNPPDLPKVDNENQVFLDGLLTAFGLHGPAMQLDSAILTDPKHVHAISSFLAEDNFGQGLTLLYRGSRDGMNASTFHQKCDNQGPTVTVVKSSGNYVFGGFSDKSWRSGGGAYLNSNQSFLFGLFCSGGSEPVKMASTGTNSIYVNSSYGPRFGGGGDLATFGPGGSQSILGTSYVVPPGGNAYYFAGSPGYNLSDLEVFKVEQTGGKQVPLQQKAEPRQTVAIDSFPDEIRLSIKAEEEALLEASNELAELKDAFDKEQSAVEIFCSGDDDKIANLNVSGHPMAVKHSTLAKYPDSVLYKQFADKNWNGKQTQKVSPREWDRKKVLAWSKTIPGLSQDVSCHFRDITGAELLVLGREDINALGIKRPGTVAVVVDAIHQLRREEEENSATFIEHSDYCFGKIIDHMRLKAMTPLDVRDPSPPEIRKPDRKRFKCIVKYYFPTQESASQFLA